MKDIELVWKNLQNTMNALEAKYSESEKRKYGIYWTSLDLAYEIVDDLFIHFDDKAILELENKKFLEPCVGMGSFIFAYLKKLFEIGFETNQILKVISNIYFCDIDELLLLEFFSCYKYFLSQLWDIEIDEDLFNRNSANGLIYKHGSQNYIGLKEAFNKEIRFDIIITNPPYKNLKIDSSHYSNNDEYISDKKYYKQLSERLKFHFKLSDKGTLNIYKLFVEKILTSYCTTNAYISILIPNTLLADKSSFVLRRYCLENMQLKQITNYSENKKLFRGVTQALSNIYIKNTNDHSQDIVFKSDGKVDLVNAETIISIDSNLTFISYKPEEIKTLITLSKFPKIKDFNFIKNQRGEFDMSLNKSYLTQNTTGYQLVKGAAIDKYLLKKIDGVYVDKDFYNTTKKNVYIDSPRIACPQISNQKTQQRIKFSLVSENNVLANSCNFIYVDENPLDYDLYYFLGLLNTDIINWYFKKFNSNNHIGNYEIASFPIHDDRDVIKEISQAMQEYLMSGSPSILKNIEKKSLEGFNLNDIDCSVKVDSLRLEDVRDKKKYYKRPVQGCDSDFERILQLATDYRNFFVRERFILNNDGYKLSDLDLEMITNIPPGGNWKDIPESVVKKSKRLTQITKSGGRTTLYGRMDYDKPSYTITTYFNRPGNGTYVHPKIDRVITAREAARLQSFPDSYYFYGNQKDVLQQIGNAVPCKFAEKIGLNISRLFPNLKTFGDLFSGAGGMSQGLFQAGLNPIFANDISMAACITHKVNHPNTDVIYGSISDNDVKEKIYGYRGKIDILVGGPPCQGFSHAGKRIIDDPRNQMFMEFISAIAALTPSVVIMENVPGFITLDNGKFLSQAKDLWKRMGYTCEASVMDTSHYGVPQKRKRVILIGVKTNIIDNIGIEKLFPHPDTLDEETQYTIYDAIVDLERVEVNTVSSYLWYYNDYLATINSFPKSS